MEKKQDILETIDLIKNESLNLSVEEGLNDFLGCSILREEEKKECWILQTHLIKKLKKDFGPMIENHRDYLTPGTPRLII